MIRYFLEEHILQPPFRLKRCPSMMALIYCAVTITLFATYLAHSTYTKYRNQNSIHRPRHIILLTEKMKWFFAAFFLQFVFHICGFSCLIRNKCEYVTQISENNNNKRSAKVRIAWIYERIYNYIVTCTCFMQILRDDYVLNGHIPASLETKL